MQNDPILVLDVGCNNILACHINLFIGTLARFVHKRPDLKPLIRRALDFDFCGNFLLSEIDHGLDILNLETTATKTADGYILNTPHEGASK
jgi:acyl-CoA oxidase